MTKAVTVNLSDRAILRLTGKDILEFLQGIITQNINKLEEEGIKGVYSAMLTPQGRFLYDFFVIRGEGYPNEVLIDCNSKELMSIAEEFNKYVIGKDVEFHDETYNYTVYAKYIETDNSFNNDTNSNYNGIVYTDTRHPAMGERIILKETESLEVAGGDETTGKLADYNQHRINLGVIDGSCDGIEARTLANELNLDILKAVDFNKGCYVGQEMTIRTKHRTKPKKRVVIIEVAGELEEGQGVETGVAMVATTGNEEEIRQQTITNSETGEKAGWLFSRYKSSGGDNQEIITRGLAIIRTKEFESKLLIQNKELKIISDLSIF